MFFVILSEAEGSSLFFLRGSVCFSSCQFPHWQASSFCRQKPVVARGRDRANDYMSQ